ncbi:hypothetical protein [Modestobacter roseus]|uniref:DUF5872 domain-containing protein n=1 Tax=Modestobacter roseus TaxID=1181884 RepID=A0A562IMF2_9ACTN|nr:hypothetical protein [Modestobacter roseus]MQA34978.1 hypothetical protein [Modestobacter roseus]TWH72191.1 hypothetical protein JD78_00699 [Modestobacter roseus]
MSGKSAEDYAGDYSDPELRERLKEKIKAGDRGGRPGQWSARKSQLLVHEYEQHGGGYRHEGERSESQQHLRQWTEQDWHTGDGGDRARHGDHTGRYLPDAAWQLLSDDDRAETERVKERAQDQHVPNTDAAREARAAAELVGMTADEAQRAVRRMSGDSQLDRAEQAERELGSSRKTVLAAIESRRRRS